MGALSSEPRNHVQEADGGGISKTRRTPSRVVIHDIAPAHENGDSYSQIRINCAPISTNNSLSRTFGNVGGLRPLGAFGDFELDRVAFLQALVAFGTDCAVVYENVRTVGASDEPVALGVIKPLHRAFQSFHVPPLSARPYIWGWAQGRARIGCILERLGWGVKTKQQGKNFLFFRKDAIELCPAGQPRRLSPHGLP
jgi:hypothetical protein